MSIDTKRPTDDQPVDGLDGAIHVSPMYLLRSIYAFFHNKRVGLVLILIMGLLGLLGVLFPQAPAGVRDDPASKQAWLEGVRPTYGGWTDIMDSIGFFNMFSSVPWIVMMVLLAISILACTTHRLPLLYQTAFRPHTRMTSEFFNRARLNASFTTSAAPGEVVATIRADAKRNRVRVIADDRGPGENLYTDKYFWAPFGTAVAHLAFVVIMAGFLVSSLTGFRDEQFTLTVGRPAEVGHGTGLVAEAKSFSDTYYDDGTPKDYVTDLVLTRDGTEVARQEVRVNDPLVFEGVMFHQAFFGISAVMQVSDPSGQDIFHDGVTLEWNTPDRSMVYGVVELPGGQEMFVITPASGTTGTGIEPGQVRLEVYETGSNVPLGTAVLDQGGSVDVDGLTFTFEREQQYTGILVKRDPGTGIVWLGCALLVIGTCATMFLRHHRIWFRVTGTEDGSCLVQLASQDRQDATFARRFTMISDELNQQLSNERVDTDA
ncbi:MAG: cytochrome c biogenesis protein ResB [Brooklawnia sp.]